MNASAITPLRIAVIGTGISGLSAAWLLSQRHEVTLYEANGRPGGHAHTVEVAAGGAVTPVDTGFIVYNEPNYPNLTALFEHLEVPTRFSDMSFSVSLDEGALEYSSYGGLSGLFAQPSNLLNPRFWGMLADLSRFYRTALADLPDLERAPESLGDYLAARGYGASFCEDHLLPQAAAIWSSRVCDMAQYPAAALIRFYENHGLLRLRDRIDWRTVEGGSRAYVSRLLAAFRGRVRLQCPIVHVARNAEEAVVTDARGGSERFDQVVVATHADQALRLLDAPSPEERTVLGAIGYSPNRAVLHRDPALMPRRKAAWAAWNHIGRRGDVENGCVTYWMNRLQGLSGEDLFVTLNPIVEPDPAKMIRSDFYEHPLYDGAAAQAQQRLWGLQGVRRTWYCGAYFGSGFHEDGLQAGLAVAEQLGGVRRPWIVENESGRIRLNDGVGAPLLELAA